MKYVINIENKEKPFILVISLFNDKDKITSSTYLKGMPLKASLEIVESWINKDIRGFKNFEVSYKEPVRLMG